MAFKVAYAFKYEVDEVILYPLAKLMFYNAGLRVLSGDDMPTKHLSSDTKKLVQTAADKKDEMLDMMKNMRRGT